RNQHREELVAQRVQAHVGKQLAQLGRVGEVEPGDSLRVLAVVGEAAEVVLQESELREEHQNGGGLERQLDHQRGAQVGPDMAAEEVEPGGADGASSHRERL